MSNVFLYIPPEVGPWTDPVTGDTFKPGLPKFDVSDSDTLDQVNRAITAGAGFDVSQLVSALIQIAWANITGKPSSFTPSAHTHTAAEIVSGQFANDRISEPSVTQHQAALALTIAQIAGLQTALDALVSTSEKGATNGIATLDANTTIPLAQIPTLSASQTGSGVFDPARIPDLDWSKIIEATRPDTLAGYGITDALTATEVGQQIQSAIDALVGGAPGALDTLNELAAALGDDPNAITTLTNAVASKLDASLWQAATAAVDGYMSKEDKAKLDGIEEGATGDMTAAEIKAAYESEADTNAFTDADKTKLDGIAAGATANASNAQLRDRSTHSGTQAQSTVDNLEQDLADRLLRSELPFASLAHFSSTDDATDMAAGATVQWNSTLMADSGISIGGANNTELTVAEAGRYVITARLVYADTSTEGVDVNNTLGATVLLNGVSVGRQGVGSPVVNTDGANEGQVIITEPLDLEPGDVVTVTTQRLSGGDELYLIAGQSSLLVERKGGKSAALAAQKFRELSDTPNDYTAEGAILRVKTGGGIEYTLTIPQSAVAGLPEALAKAVTTDTTQTIEGGKSFKSLRLAGGVDYTPDIEHGSVFPAMYVADDVLQMRTPLVVEYHDGADWVAWPEGVELIRTMLDGTTSEAEVPLANKRFRFVVSTQSWLIRQKLFIHRTWTSTTAPYTVKIEVDNNQGMTSPTEVFNTPAPVGGTNKYYYLDYFTYHGADQYYRIEFDFPTAPVAQKIAMVSIFSLYARGGVKGMKGLPFLWNKDAINTPVETLRVNDQEVFHEGNFDPDSKADADLVGGETLLTADATLNDATAPPGKLVRVKAAGATDDRITLTLDNDRPQGWRRTILVSDGTAAFDLGNNTLTVGGEAVPSGDTPVITAGGRATLIADTAGNLVRY